MFSSDVTWPVFTKKGERIGLSVRNIERCTKDEYSLFGSRCAAIKTQNSEYKSFGQSSIILIWYGCSFCRDMTQNRHKIETDNLHPCYMVRILSRINHRWLLPNTLNMQSDNILTQRRALQSSGSFENAQSEMFPGLAEEPTLDSGCNFANYEYLCILKGEAKLNVDLCWYWQWVHTSRVLGSFQAFLLCDLAVWQWTVEERANVRRFSGRSGVNMVSRFGMFRWCMQRSWRSLACPWPSVSSAFPSTRLKKASSFLSVWQLQPFWKSHGETNDSMIFCADKEDSGRFTFTGPILVRYQQAFRLQQVRGYMQF